MLGFLFRAEAPVIEDDARAQLRDDAAEILAASRSVLEGLDSFEPEVTQAALRAKLVEEMEIKPRFAFTPLRVAITGRRVSPPLFESMELLGRDAVLERIDALARTVG